MSAGEASPDLRERIDAIYRADSRRVLATLIRLLGDFDLAEEALQDAMVAALQQWPEQGIPANPRAWLVSAGRFKAVDRLRRRARFDATVATVLAELDDAATSTPAAALADDEGVGDDRLRLIFTCCHPALSPDAQVALTLREVCGLTTEQVASAFLTPAPTLAQRIVRAKAKIRIARIPYEIPERADLPRRLASVLHVIYLVFNEGYMASSGGSVTRPELSAEALRLGRLLVELLPEAEAIGLLALMLLHGARDGARASEAGEILLLEEQDRTRWDRAMIEEGLRLVERALTLPGFGPYAVQAAIAAVHAEAGTADATDWAQIAGLYDVLMRMAPSPIVALNRAAAIAMRDGPAVGLAMIEEIMSDGALDDYRMAHAARGELCRRLGRVEDAIRAYERAATLAVQKPEQRFIARRLDALRGSA